MKERPILFSAPMVRVMLEGRKTQTRRIVKNKTALEWLEPDIFTPEFVADPDNEFCPYGQPGDRLWVRETWGNLNIDFPLVAPYFVYRADGEDHGPVTWRPSIHMPRAASRILLEVLDVRVERLQEINEEDAISEGIEITPIWNGPGDVYPSDPVEGYKRLWQSIHGPESWDKNPWVWVVEFRRIEQ